MTLVCPWGLPGQPCPGPLGEHGHQALAPGIEADHSAGHAAVSVLLPVHRRGWVAGEIRAGELAECVVQNAGQFVGRGRQVLAARWARRARQRWGSPRRPHVSGSGPNRSDTRTASGSLPSQRRFAQPPPRARAAGLRGRDQSRHEREGSATLGSMLHTADYLLVRRDVCDQVPALRSSCSARRQRPPGLAGPASDEISRCHKSMSLGWVSCGS